MSPMRGGGNGARIRLNSVGGYDRRGTGRAHGGGGFASFDCGNTSHFREECPVFLTKIQKFKKGNGKGGGRILKVREI